MLRPRLAIPHVLQTVSGIMCLERRGEKIAMDTLAKRGCVVSHMLYH